jgi:hypothetical protein
MATVSDVSEAAQLMATDLMLKDATAAARRRVLLCVIILYVDS